MKKNTKKKILTLALVIALLAIVMVGGSLAWFTDTDEAVNTFTVGSIKIVQHEKEHNDAGELVDFTPDKVLLPIVNIDNPADDDNYEEKIVTVENTGKNDAYIRTWIAVPKALDNYLVLDTNSTSWTEQWAWPTGTVDGVEYVAHCYVYSGALASGATTAEAVLNGVYLKAPVDVKDNPATAEEDYQFCLPDGNGGYTYSGFVLTDNTKVNVLVVTQAVQVEGFANAQEALNAAFEEPINVTAVPFFN